LSEICKKVIIAIWYGDFYSTNDNYPFLIERTQRGRLWLEKSSGKLIRIEYSKKLLNDQISPIPDAFNHKL
jgi:hypothetical protein